MLLSSRAAAAPIFASTLHVGSAASCAEGKTSSTTLTFGRDSLCRIPPTGSITTTREDVLVTPSYNRYGRDWWIDAQASQSGSGQFIIGTGVSASNDATGITLLDALSKIGLEFPDDGIAPSPSPSVGGPKTGEPLSP